MPGENENHSYTFYFKLVYTGLTSSKIICAPNLLSITWSEFMNSTLSTRQSIIHDDNLEYDIVVSGQPNAERAPPLVDGIGFLSMLHQNTNDSFSFYIRPKNQSFVYYLRENCPNEGLLHSLSVSDTYELFLHGRVEGAQADTGDEEPEPEPVLEPELEPTCENMTTIINPVPTQNDIPPVYTGVCCCCFENRDLSDHWQCYIPDGANRHGICITCFDSYRSSSSRPHDCPVCRQPLGATNYGMIAPIPIVVTSTYSETINPPEPSMFPNAIQDFPYGGSGAVGPQDSEDAAGPPEPNHQNFLNNFSNWNWNNNTTNLPSGPSGPYHNITTTSLYDSINNMENVPRIEVRNQEIIIRNIPYNEMVDLQRHNPNNNNTNTSNNTLRESLVNVISRQINNISNNNRINTNIFNESFYNVDNNGNPIG